MQGFAQVAVHELPFARCSCLLSWSRACQTPLEPLHLLTTPHLSGLFIYIYFNMCTYKHVCIYVCIHMQKGPFSQHSFLQDMHAYLCVRVCMCINIYIYIYTYVQHEVSQAITTQAKNAIFVFDTRICICIHIIRDRDAWGDAKGLENGNVME